MPIPGTEPLHARRHERRRHDMLADDSAKLERVQERGRGRLLLRRPRPRPASASTPSASAARSRIVCRAIPFDIKTDRGARPAAGHPRAGRRGARHHPADRHHRLGQVHDARGDDRPHQLDRCQAHRHDRGPDRVPAPRQAARSSTSARSAWTPTSFKPRPAPRPAPGPRRDPDRRDARRGDGPAPRCRAAETGHLVLSTLHTVDAAETVNRIIDFFPPHSSSQVRAMLAGTLKGVISQRLVPTSDGDGRVAVLRDPAHDRPRPGHDHGPGRRPAGCPRSIAEGELLRHADLRPGAASSTSRPAAISMDEALKARHPAARLQAAGRRRRPPGTTMDDLAEAEARRSAPQHGRVLRPPPGSPGPAPYGRPATLPGPASRSGRLSPTRADDPRRSSTRRSPRRVRAAELQAAEGRASSGTRSRPSSGSMVAYQGDVTLRARRLAAA